MVPMASTIAPSGPLHLHIPERHHEESVASDHDGSFPEEPMAAVDFSEERAHSIIGVSISRAQTRFMSPQTPAAEKAAAMEDLEGGGWFDGPSEEEDHTPVKAGEGQWDLSASVSAKDSETSIPLKPSSRDNTANLPSPWRASPKTFQKQRTRGQSHPSTGPTNMLSDLNVRRYMSSINLPSLPKAPSFKDFSIPSLSSILNNTRSRSPLRKTPTRQGRASTINDPSSSRSLDRPFASRPTPGMRTEDDYGSRKTYSPDTRRASNIVISEATEDHEPYHHDATKLGRPRAASIGSAISRQNPSLRRVDSDQSLLLRRITSTGSSLGDDSRWEHVQEQVNSRMKAIKDSLQDSSIKLPSMPNFSSFNLGSFRPEFTKTQLESEPGRPYLYHVYPITGHPNQVSNKDIPTKSKDITGTTQEKAVQASKKPTKTAESCLDTVLDDLTGDLVILGGYRGSILRSSEPPHRQLWVPVKVGLNIRKVNLEVGLNPEDEENMHDHIFASGMLSHIGPIDMGRRLLKRLHACKNVQEGILRIHDYGWDWRLSPHLMSRRLIAFLAELPCNKPGLPPHEKGATIIAHSMGGLITRHAVNKRPELFAGVVYAGVPQHCINILGPLRNGDDVLLSSKVLTAQVNFTLRTSFLLLPDSGKCFINKVTKEEYAVDFFNVEHWKEYAWSPCVAPSLPSTTPQETKTLLGSVAEMLPSMPSLPLPGRKASSPVSRTNDSKKSNNADIADAVVTKGDDLANLSAIEPSLSPPLSTTHTSSNSTTNPQCTIPLPLALAYLTRTLAATLAFKAEMVFDPTFSASQENLYPPLSILYANNTPTVAAARVSSREAIKCADAYDDLQFGSGDGVCLARAAMLPEGYECVKGGKVKTERGHVGLLGDLEAVGRCLGAVLRGRREGVGLGGEVRRN